MIPLLIFRTKSANFSVVMIGKAICRHKLVHVFRAGDEFKKVVLRVPLRLDILGNEEPSNILKGFHGGIFRCTRGGSPRDFGEGCQGLQELSLLMGSDVWNFPVHLIDPKFVILREKLAPGCTSQEIAARRAFESGFRSMFTTPQQFSDHYGIRPARDWNGAAPSLQVVSLSPRPTASNPRYMDSMLLSRYFYNALTTKLSQQALEDFVERTKCFLFTKTVFVDGCSAIKGEIGFYGIDQEAIDKAKQEVKDMLVSPF